MIVRPACGSARVREPEKLFRVDRTQRRNRRSLDELTFQRRDRKWALPTIRRVAASDTRRIVEDSVPPPNGRRLNRPFGFSSPSPSGLERRFYSAGTIGVEARSSSRRSTGRRMLAMKRRSSLCTAPGLRKCEANSRLISTGRQ
jgi:hypothetical protein